MGENEEWPQPNGLLLNGLLPIESASVIRVLDKERWVKAEERTAELIACIQPNQPSEDRRGAVADYVQRLISKCFPCEVFTFGSVPLKTYLPDGDIDLTAFSKNLALKDTWGILVRDILASEEKNENAEFRVKEVQYIQAEVKIVKCLVENIVVDISFNQLGGLCTLCFLEEVDNLINQNHLFKRSIILIKAWCYYESRILGAHHGLISTYALETLVLYIFHIFNNSFAGPLEVLLRFLEFFSNFDWDNFCVSLWGPVPVSTLPDINAEPPRKDGGELLLSKLFLHACNSVYAVVPGMQENHGQPFVSKHFNVIDPLRLNNNLGRSVSKGNFFRIRSAFAFGAKRLARLLDCSKENIASELNQFFMNTWERHVSGIHPDAPTADSQHSIPLNSDDRSGNLLNPSSSKETSENVTHVIEAEARPLSSQRSSYPLESTSKCNDAYVVSSGQSQKVDGKLNSSRMQDPTEKGNSNLSVQNDRSQRGLKPDKMVNQLQGKHLFARTRSSPELTDAYCDASFRQRRIKPTEGGNGQPASTKMDSSQRKSLIYDTVSTQRTVSSSDDPSSGRHSSSHHVPDATADSTSLSNSFVVDSLTAAASEDHAPVIGAQGMHQEEQDLVNMMASSSIHNFGGHMPMPLNFSSPHTMLTSMGYGHRSVAGMVPANFPLIDPRWATNFPFHQGSMSSPFTQYFPGIGLPVNSEELLERGSESFNSVEMHRSADPEYGHERDVASNGVFGLNDRSLEILHAEDRQPSTSASSNLFPSSRVTSFNSPLKAQRNLNKEHLMSMRDDCVDNFKDQNNRLAEICSDDRVSSARFSSASQASSVRSKTSSESSWDGSSARISKVAGEKGARKTVGSVAAPSNAQGKGKRIHDGAPPEEADDWSRDWSTLPTTGNDIDKRSLTSSAASTLHDGTHHVSGFEGAQTSGSDSVVPIAPILMGPGSRQKVADNAGVVPFAFYPTGPPVPFFTMLPVFNYPAEGDSSEPSSSPLGGEDGPANSDSGQNFESSEGQDAPHVLNAYNHMRRATITELCEDPKPDILHSDFASHWQNLQYGRICQSPRYPASVGCPSPAVVPPMYLQGHHPLEGPGRPLSVNANLLSQLMSYGHPIVPVAPLHSGQSRPATVYQRYPDEVPRYRSGTGTYLPNPKAAVRERHSSSAKRNSYNYDRSDHADREGNWNSAKSRAAGHSYRNQAEKSRNDRFEANENRADRSWGAYRHDQLPSFHAQNGQIRPNSSQGSPANMGYGMYQFPGMNPGGVTTNGPSAPPVVMLYPYDHNSGYVSPGDQLEFGTLGPVGFVGLSDQPADAAQLRGAYEDQRFHRSSTQHSSPDQPSSPHFQRRI